MVGLSENSDYGHVEEVYPPVSKHVCTFGQLIFISLYLADHKGNGKVILNV